MSEPASRGVAPVAAAGGDGAGAEPGGLSVEALDALAVTRRDLPRAATLPGICFTGRELFALEQRRLFAPAWRMVARAEDLPSPGSYRRVEVDGESILLIRSEHGIGAWYNVCLHRGSRLVDGVAGRLSQLRCPYHAWCYDLQGRLTHVPRDASGKRAGCERSLHPVRLAEWGGYLFVNLDPAAPELEAVWHDLPDLSPYRMHALTRAHVETYEVRANWKLICENYSECYHCPGAHPQLSRLSDYLEDHAETGVFVGDCFNGGPMRLRDGAGTMSMSGERRLPMVNDALCSQAHRLVHYYLVYPDLFVSPHPDYVLVHRLTPVAPDLTRVSCEWLVAPAGAAMASAVADVVDFWHLTNQQDWVLCERNQAGVASRAYRPGPYHSSEACVHAFDAWYAERVLAIVSDGA